MLKVREEVKTKIDTTPKIAAQNQGGVLGGLGYVGASAIAGLGSIFEGVIDATVALGADLTGNHDFAESMFKNNVVGDWHEGIRQDFNPSRGWGLAGDVAQGIGQSATLFIPVAGVPLFYTGVVSQGISGAAQKTGEVGFKEVAYGAVTGATEGLIDAALGGTASKIGSAMTKGFGKGVTKGATKATAKAAANATRKGLVKTVLSSAASEFAEEFVGDYVDITAQNWLQIDPNAQYSFKDALYSGMVGAISGAATTSVATVPRSIAYNRKGRQIIENGNSQTLVNTANLIADRLAARGTDFKKAPEWAAALRGQVKAYDKLVKANKGDSASAATILGEMQAYLFYAETQSIHSAIQSRIQNADEGSRAAWAEYINLVVDAKDRKRTYTAQDVANDVDGVASQLASLQFAGMAINYDEAALDAEREAAIAEAMMGNYESGAQSAESGAQGAESGAQGAESGVTPTVNAAEVDPASYRQVTGKLNDTAAQSGAQADITAGAEAQEALRRDAADIESEAKIIDDDIGRIGEDVKKAVSKITVDGKVYELTNKHVRNIAEGAQKYIRQGMSEDEAVTRAVNERLVDIKELGEGGKITHQVGKNRLAKIKGVIINEYKRELQSRAKKGAEAEKSAEGVAESGEAEGVAEVKDRGETAKKSSENSEKSSENSEKSSEDKNDAPKISEPKEILNEAQRAERARKRAERIIEWEKENAPSVKELNRVRSYVKGFDNLSPEKRQSIMRMLRSAEGVDEKIVKGVANLMAIKAGADLEVRFDDKVKEYGLTATIGDKTLILVSSMADYKDTVKGTVAHELVHYLEKKPGYKTFAEHVMARVKPEAKARVEKDVTARYNEHYKTEYRSELEKQGLKGKELEGAVAEKLASPEHKAMIDSEVTAELVGQALNNDKFLARYARRGNTDGFIKKAWRFLKGIVQELKSKEENELAEILMPTIKSMDRLLKMGNVGESKSGVKYAINENFNNQIDNWDGKTIGFSFVVGETSQALQEAGIPNKQIRWDASKIAKLLDKHSGMTKEIVKQIPYLLENPIIVIDSKQNSNAKIVMGDLYDSNGKIITVVLLLTPTSKKGNVLKMIKISSAEGRGHIQSLFKNDDGSPVAVRYVDKKRIQSWLNVNRLQLPLHNLDLDSTNSIHQNEPVVNSSVKKTDEKHSLAVKKLQADAEYLKAVESGDMETAQKMVDEAAKKAMPNSVLRDNEGNLIKLYHGSSKTFNEFRGKELGSAGNYFSPWEDFARGYGEVRAFYVNLENPEIFDNDWNKLNDVPEKNSDGIIYTPEDMEGGIDQEQIGDTEIIVYGSKGIKSADPVTYDDDGNVIPLSERFNVKKRDIRYSLAPKKSQTNAKKAGKKVGAESAEGKQSARKSATVVGEYSKRFEKSFDLDKGASEKIAAELEAIENAFVKGDEEYADVFRRRVGNIAGVIAEKANFEIASDYDVLSDFSRYMVRKRFRVDSRFRSEMGNEWKDIYKSLKGRIASDKNTQYSRVDKNSHRLSERED